MAGPRPAGEVDMSIPFEKASNVPEQEVIEGDAFKRYTEWFTSQGVRCHAWLYLPTAAATAAADGSPAGNEPGGDGALPPPVVLMAHGLGAQKDMGLSKYAEAFAAMGMAALVFDYRGFGGSDGKPRNLAHPWRHVEDYQAAIDHVKASGLGGRVNPSRMALWGTSFAGGHVLKVAATRGGDIKAVVSQVPHLDGRAASKKAVRERGLGLTLRMVYAVLRDLLRSSLGMGAGYIRIVGIKGDGGLALMSLAEDQYAQYFSKHPKEYLGGWRNMAPARLGSMIGLYSPLQDVPKVEMPVLFVAAENDTLCPAEKVREAAELAPRGSSVIKDCSHFDIYGGEVLQDVLKDMTSFLEEHLLRGDYK